MKNNNTINKFGQVSKATVDTTTQATNNRVNTFNIGDQVFNFRNEAVNIDQTIIIHNWMLDLELNANDLIIYALIYSYTQNGKLFYQSADTLGETLNVDRRSIFRSLNRLRAKTLIEEVEDSEKPEQLKKLKNTFYRSTDQEKEQSGKNFITIRTAYIKALELKGFEILLFSFFDSFKEPYYTTIDRLAEKFKRNRQTIMAVMEKLVDVEKVVFRGKHRRSDGCSAYSTKSEVLELSQQKSKSVTAKVQKSHQILILNSNHDSTVNHDCDCHCDLFKKLLLNSDCDSHSNHDSDSHSDGVPEKFNRDCHANKREKQKNLENQRNDDSVVIFKKKEFKNNSEVKNVSKVQKVNRVDTISTKVKKEKKINPLVEKILKLKNWNFVNESIIEKLITSTGFDDLTIYQAYSEFLLDCCTQIKGIENINGYFAGICQLPNYIEAFKAEFEAEQERQRKIQELKAQEAYNKTPEGQAIIQENLRNDLDQRMADGEFIEQDDIEKLQQTGFDATALEKYQNYRDKCHEASTANYAYIKAKFGIPVTLSNTPVEQPLKQELNQSFIGETKKQKARRKYLNSPEGRAEQKQALINKIEQLMKNDELVDKCDIDDLKEFGADPDTLKRYYDYHDTYFNVVSKNLTQAAQKFADKFTIRPTKAQEVENSISNLKQQDASLCEMFYTGNFGNFKK